MSAERVAYVDSSAIVKLVIRERESTALRAYLRRRTILVSSALARVEVERASLSVGPEAHRHARIVLSHFELVRINERVLAVAAALLPADIRSLDAIHLATASLFEATLSVVLTYDARMAAAARSLGWRVAAPS